MKVNKKIVTSSALITALSASIVPYAVLAEAKEESVDQVYRDVTPEDDHFEGIMALTELGIVDGYGDGTFGQWDEVTREQVAVMLYHAANLKVPANVDEILEGYSDVDGNSLYAEQIAAVTEAGIFAGSNGEFNPRENITRQQMATVLVQAFNLDDYLIEEKEIHLDNVALSHKRNVQILASAGATNQLDDFRPTEAISRGAFATQLHQVIQLTKDRKDNFELSVMHTNDLHAHVETAPKIATAVKEVRAEKPNALLLDAGDVFQGTLYFTQYEGQADVALMNYLEYDAMTLGNHEFDLGKSEKGHQALADFVTRANFPIVTANVDFSADEKLAGLHKEEIATEAEAGSIYDGMILEVEGEKIGIFGLTTETTAGSSSPERVVFENYLEEAEKAVASLEEQGVDKIIAVTHLGFETPTTSNDSLLATHVDGGEASDPTVIVQTGTAGANLGTLDVEFDENGVIVGHAGELISVSDYEEDPEALEILQPFKDGIADVQNEETGGIALAPLENPRLGDEGNTDGISVRNSETALGNLVADSMLHEGKKVEPNATIALQNGGGVRSAVDAGPITMGEVLTVLSFNNGLYSVELTGEEMIRVLEGGVAAVPGESGSFLHTAGLKVEFDSSKPVKERIISVEAQDENGNYSPIELEASYTLITNIYIALGNGYNGVFREAAADGRVTDIGLSDWESFANYLGEMGEVDPQVEGRTVDIAE